MIGKAAIGISLLALALPAALPAMAQDWPARCRNDAARGLTAACEQAVQADPDDPELYALLGQGYFTAGSYLEGLQIMRIAIEKSHGAPDYRYRFAGYAALINEFVEAADELKQIVAVRPDDVKAWSLLADCYRFLKDDSGALLASRNAAELGDAAEAYALAGRYAEGIGVAQDFHQEQDWLERAAGEGYVAAMQDLVRFYADGRPGIPADAVKRRQWEAAVKRAMQPD
ncbi:MAG TPA: hypothetical protein VF194_07805 [Ferrovibrio sp.]|uniref:hypothetical protein n=1 Tax=Ferrovibrio sp. TaxID=1917215 RepID=UPI002ED45CFD